MRVKSVVLGVICTAFCASSVRAEYFVLRSGQRLTVTGYQLIDGQYHLQMKGGTVDVAADQVVNIEPEDTFTPVPQVHVSQEPFGELIEAAAKRYSVDVDLITSVIAAESNFDPKAISRRNARGLMQLLPSTAAHLGVKNIFDPQENIDAGTHYLSELMLLYKNDLALTLAAYNAGPERVQRYGQRVPPFAETISYVKRVKQTFNERKERGAARSGKTPVAASRVATSTNTVSPAGKF